MFIAFTSSHLRWASEEIKNLELSLASHVTDYNAGYKRTRICAHKRTLLTDTHTHVHARAYAEELLRE